MLSVTVFKHIISENQCVLLLLSNCKSFSINDIVQSYVLVLIHLMMKPESDDICFRIYLILMLRHSEETFLSQIGCGHGAWKQVEHHHHGHGLIQAYCAIPAVGMHHLEPDCEPFGILLHKETKGEALNGISL